MARRRRLGALLLIIALPALATVHAAYVGPQLHDVRVSALGPAVVAQAAAQAASGDRAVRVEAVPVDLPVESSAAKDVAVSVDRARALVLDGTSDAAVVIDLAASSDTLLVPTYRSDAFAQTLLARLAPISNGYGRDLRVERVDSARSDAPGWSGSALLVAWVALGLLLAAGFTAWRGPVPASENRAALRLVLLVATGCVAALLVGLVAAASWSTHLLPVTLAGAGTIVTVAWLTTAAENLLGLTGLVAAVTLGTAPMTTLLVGSEPDTLPAPWDRVRLILPQDAGYRLATGVTQQLDHVLLQPAALLAAWSVIAVLAMGAAYRFRPDHAAPQVG